MRENRKELKPESCDNRISRKQEYMIVALFLIITGYLVVSGLYEPETVVYNYDVTATASFNSDEVADTALATMTSIHKENVSASDTDVKPVVSSAEKTESTVSAQDADSKLININTATVEQLDELDGIGTVKAQRIIDYRESHGGFSTIYEITNVDGIGDSTYNNIKDHITVDG